MDSDFVLYWQDGKQCNKPCAGLSTTMCGGEWRNSIYKITVEGQKDEVHTYVMLDLLMFTFSAYLYDVMLFRGVTHMSAAVLRSDPSREHILCAWLHLHHDHHEQA